MRLSAGTATLTTSLPLTASQQITATYTPDVGNFTGSNTTVTVQPLASLYVLNTSAGGALTLSGNAQVVVPGYIDVDSSSASAIAGSGNAVIKATGITVVGGVTVSGHANFSPSPTTHAAATADPFATLPAPAVSGSVQSAVNVGSGTRTINPGIYSAIAVSGNGALTMNPGIYIIAGGGFSVSGNGTVNGTGTVNGVTGVLIDNAGTQYAYNSTTGVVSDGGSFGAFSLSGNAIVKLTAPSTGAWAGLAIFQPHENTQPMTLSGNNASTINGSVYAPAAALTLSGNAKLQDALVVGTLTLSGNAIFNNVSLTAPDGGVAYGPAQLRGAYGVNSLAYDGTGQTIAIIDAYDDPDIYQAADQFDALFGTTASGASLYDQYGPASAFLSVVNQAGQPTPLPAVDPTGAGVANWESEEALDVEWAHAMAPGAQVVLVEANSQSLADLMSAAGAAAHLPGVTVVSMSWGFPEGQAVLAADEALYDGDLTTPAGHIPVTFVASTGDFGAADPEYPAFSPNVVAIGGTSLTLNADDSYNSEVGWGYYSDAVGAFIASGGGISAYEPQPAYQNGVQSTGYRTTPDVALVADPNTGAWIADTYNLPADNPMEVVGGTSLSAPAWAGLIALVDQGRVAAGLPTLSSNGGTTIQAALYSAPVGGFNAILGGSNGAYTASTGYNYVTGLGTPVANVLIPSLIAYQGTAAPNATAASGGPNGSGTASTNEAINIFNALPDDAALGRFADARTPLPAANPIERAPAAPLPAAPPGTISAIPSSALGMNGPPASAILLAALPIAPTSTGYLLDVLAGPTPDVARLAGSLFASTQNGDDSDDILGGGGGSDFAISACGPVAEQRDRSSDHEAPAALDDSAADLRAAYVAVFAEAAAADGWVAGELDLAQLWTPSDEE